MKIPDRLKRGLVMYLAFNFAALVLCGGLGVVGHFYQQRAEQADRQQFPPRGQLLDVNGLSMHLYCTGSGSPTMVLEARPQYWSIHWKAIQERLAQETRVCSYDRAGYGWSEPGPLPRDNDRLNAELRALLSAAGEQSPYILVADSYSEPLVLGFQQSYPSDVAGLVLILPVHSDYLGDMTRQHTGELKQFAQYGKLLAPLGLIRVIQSFDKDTDIPKNIIPQHNAGLATKAYNITMLSELDSIAEPPLAENMLGQTPLGIITRDLEGCAPDTESAKEIIHSWDANNQAFAALSENVHTIQLPTCEGLLFDNIPSVADAILEMAKDMQE